MLKHTVDCIVILTIHLEQTGAGIVNIAAIADEFAVFEFVVMPGRRKRRSPINNGSAFFAVSSSAVTVGRAGRRNVFERLSIMFMPYFCLISGNCSSLGDRTAEGTCSSADIFDLAVKHVSFHQQDRLAVRSRISLSSGHM